MLTIAVLHYNNEELTKACLESIMQQRNIGEVELLLVDNGSAKLFPDLHMWKVVRLPKNVGNIAGQNACFDHAMGDLVLFVSNDVRFEAGCITSMLRFAKGEKNPWGQIQPRILNEDLTEQNCGMDYRWPGYGISRTKMEWIKTPIVASITYLMSKFEWAKRGGFDERFPMAYEDVDFALTGQDMGRGPNLIAPDAYAVHLGNATLQYTLKDKWRFREARRLVIRKHFRGLDRWCRLAALSIIDTLRPL